MRKRFKIVLKIAMLVMLFAFTNVMYAQRNITGLVKDAKDGNVLPGVNIMVKGTTVGATTNPDGKFALKLPDGSNVLVVSFIGYETQEIILIDAKDDYEVLLSMSSQELGEVVVTALGIKREQKAIGYAITEVKGEEIAKANTINPIGAIQGKAAGVSIGASDGGSFAAYKMNIRGISTLKSSNQPIFVIDGVIVDNNVSGDSEWNGGTNDWGNELKNLNPDEFESVTILKGSAATALYGSRGIYGAVVIMTKQAKKTDGLGISINQSFGIDKVYATPDLQNEYGPGILAGHNYYDPNPFTTEAFYTQDVNGVTVHSLFWDDGLSFGPKFDNSAIYGYDHKMTTYKAYKNNMKDAFDTGYNTNTNVSIQGGNDKTSFFVSESYTKKTGYYPGNDFSRNSTLIKGTYKAGDKLFIDGSMSYTQSNPKNPISDMGEYFINGWFQRTYDTKFFKTRYTADHGGVPSSTYGDELADVPSAWVWFSLNNNTVSRIENTIRPIVRVSYDAFDWLKITLEGNMNLYSYKTENKQLGQGYRNEGGYYGIEHYRKEQKTGKLTFNLHHKINDISLSLIAGGEVYKTEDSWSSVHTDGGLLVPGQYFIQNSKKTILSDASIGGTKQISSTYFMFNTSWKDQLFLDITGRNDWSSALVYFDGTGKYSYFYPSISSSWLFSETFQLPEWLSFGKVRLSWAQVGNDTNPYYINQGYSLDRILQGGNYIYRNTMTGTLISPGLKPERKNSIEAGADIRFINNRFGIDMTYYKENTKDQIVEIPAPSESGVTSQLINAGNIQNSGIELTLNTTPVKTSKLKWDLNFIYTKNYNKIISLHKDVGKYKSLAGSPNYGNYRVGSVAYIGGEYGVLLSDILPQRDANGNKVLTYINSRRGSYYLRSGQIEKVGSILPKFEGSISSTLTYKGFDFSFMIDMRFGGYLASYSNRYGTSYGFTESSLKGRDAAHGGITWTSAYDGVTYNDGVIPDGVFAANTMVTQPNGTQVNVSGMTYRDAYAQGYVEPTHASYWLYRTNSWGQGVINDDWFSEINYIALRQLSFGYTFPSSICTKLGLKGLRLGFEAHNVRYLYNSLPNHLNPESTRGNRSDYSYFERTFSPYVATYVFNVKINL